MTTLYDDQLLFPDSGETTSGILEAPSSTPGIGIAPQTSVDPMKAEYAKMSTGRELATRIGEFGAGLRGEPSPLLTKMEAQRKKKLEDLATLKETVSALEHGVSMRQGLSGEEATTFDNAYGDQLEKIQPGLKNTFLALSKRPDLLTQFQGYAQYLPEPMQVLMKSNPKEFLKFAGTAEGMKALTEAKDRSDLRLATKKVQTAMMGLQQYVPKDKLDAIMADGVVTASDILSVQQYLPKEAQLSEGEQAAIQRNDKVFWQGLGVLHGQAEQDVLKGRADRGKAPTTRTIREGEKEIQQEWDPVAKTWKEVGRGPHFKPDTGPGGLPKETVNVELKLSDDYRQDTKKFAERKPLFESATDYMANRDKNKTSSGDAALAFAYAKMRDPNDRLAVSETRDLAKLGNIFERLGVSITGILDKGETLPDRVAKQMYDEIRRSFTEQNRAQSKIESDFTRKVKDYGGDPTRVVRPLAIPQDQLNPKRRESDRPESAPQGEVEARKKIGNVEFVKIKGQWYSK